MWRSFFLAIGVYCVILGAEALAVQSAQLKPRTSAGKVVVPAKTVSTPEWAPWSLLSAGAVVMIYSFTIPARAAG
ncbi:hypothetical protein Pla175_00260 [Pirellulimonas nuda]|uniref:Uncharacterized protein n=1 Tax=Pirellulimonas nuda TaxID=2528009 RepID=A0A518D5D1_9BACT|nr:hypothetical protein [Pirellulimonas nuda]QDU86676.1 hypothetical protein Pla175_00260 [Pirellulimonas nuda]